MESGLKAYNHGKQLIKECASHRKALLTDGSGWAQKIPGFQTPQRVRKQAPASRDFCVVLCCHLLVVYGKADRASQAIRVRPLPAQACSDYSATCSSSEEVCFRPLAWLWPHWLKLAHGLTTEKAPSFGLCLQAADLVMPGPLLGGLSKSAGFSDSDSKLFMERLWKWCMETLNDFRRRPIIFPPQIWRIRIYTCTCTNLENTYIYMYMYISDKRPNTKQQFSGGDENISL